MTKRFLLTSRNAAKTNAVKAVLGEVYGVDIVVDGISVDSGVSETPTSHDEGVEGCVNRIRNAQQAQAGYDGYLGLEGIIVHQQVGTFLCGWAVIEDAAGRRGIGCSAQVRLPKALARGLNPDEKLADKVVELYPEVAHLLPEIGTNGALTDGRYTRVNEFMDALNCAVGDLLLQQKATR